MGGIVFIIIIIFVIVPLVKKFKESLDADATKNRSRYGGYNNPNVYNDQNSKKITYDWKPDYNFLNNQSNQPDQSNQADQGTQGTQVSQNSQVTQGTQVSQGTQVTQGQNRSVQAGAKSTAPVVNTRHSSTAVSRSKTASTEQNNSKQKVTAASIRKEQHKNQEADRTAAKGIGDVHVADGLMEQDYKMPEYNSFVYSASSYEMPESDAFKYADVIVDSEVHVDAVMPGSADNVNKDVQR